VAMAVARRVMDHAERWLNRTGGGPAKS
jgi:hypothetical protein